MRASMLRCSLLLILLTAAGCSSKAPVDTAPSAITAEADGLVVRAVGMKSAKGQGAFAIYDSAETYTERRDPVLRAARSDDQIARQRNGATRIHSDQVAWQSSTIQSRDCG